MSSKGAKTRTPAAISWATRQVGFVKTHRTFTQKGLRLHLVQAPFSDEETLQKDEVTVSQGSNFSPSILTELGLSLRPRVFRSSDRGLGSHAHPSHSWRCTGTASPGPRDRADRPTPGKQPDSTRTIALLTQVAAPPQNSILPFWLKSPGFP